MTFRHDDAAEENYDGVYLRTRDHSEINVAVNWSISMLVVLEKDASRPWGKVASGKCRLWKK